MPLLVLRLTRESHSAVRAAQLIGIAELVSRGAQINQPSKVPISISHTASESDDSPAMIAALDHAAPRGVYERSTANTSDPMLARA